MIDKMLHGLRNLIGLGWGVVIDDTSEVQKVQVKFNPAEVKDNIPRYTEYGFQSSPPDGHHALVLFLVAIKVRVLLYQRIIQKVENETLKRVKFVFPMILAKRFI